MLGLLNGQISELPHKFASKEASSSHFLPGEPVVTADWSKSREKRSGKCTDVCSVQCFLVPFAWQRCHTHPGGDRSNHRRVGVSSKDMAKGMPASFVHSLQKTVFMSWTTQSIAADVVSPQPLSSTPVDFQPTFLIALWEVPRFFYSQFAPWGSRGFMVRPGPIPTPQGHQGSLCDWTLGLVMGSLTGAGG